MLPYDGTPGGNALGMQYDEQSHRFNQAMLETHSDVSAPGSQGALQIAASIVAAAVILIVLLYGTAG